MNYANGADLDAKSFYRRFVRANTPLIIRNAVRDWPAIQLWKNKYLLKCARTKKVRIELSRNGRFGHMEPSWKAGHRTIEQFLSESMGSFEGEFCYMATELPRLLASDITIPVWATFINTVMLREVNLWFALRRTISLLHNDHMHNILCMVAGRKRLVLFPPSDDARLYEDVDYVDRVSPINIDNPDFLKYPEYANARREEVVLDVGDAIYIPAYWFHQVYSRGKCIAVNFWFDPYGRKREAIQNHGCTMRSSALVQKLGRPQQPKMVESMKEPKRLSECTYYRGV